MIFRRLDEERIEPALELVWKVFMEYEAPDYSEQGVGEFRKSIEDPQFLAMLRWYGAFLDNELIGVIATRKGGSHVALFFVDGNHHRKGVGRGLFELAVKDSPTEKITVNASPFAVPVYHRLGFQDTDTEQVTSGIRYTPMEYKKEKSGVTPAQVRWNRAGETVFQYR